VKEKTSKNVYVGNLRAIIWGRQQMSFGITDADFSDRNVYCNRAERDGTVTKLGKYYYNRSRNIIIIITRFRNLCPFHFSRT